MRTSEQRVEELHRRMVHRDKEKALRGYRIQRNVAFVVCFALAVMTAFVAARVPIRYPVVGSNGASGSLFANSAFLTYVVVALLAFCLGAFVTIFCFRLRRHIEESNDDRKL